MTPTIAFNDLENLKDDLIAHLTHLFVSGQLARQIFKLTRFSTLKEENQLALRCLQNKQRGLLELGVDKIFCLNNHVEYLRNEVEGLTEEDISTYFERPFL